MKSVKKGKKVFIHKAAYVAGDVTLGDGANIWCGACIRGDIAPVVIGRNTNVQDNATVHVGYGAPAVLGVDRVSYSLDDVLPELDVVYMLRIQRERLEGAPFPSLREYHELYGLTKRREHLMKPDAIVCHPGPINRGVEFDSYMADHPERSVILDQVYAGICVRMAALYLLLGGADNGLAS